MRIRHAGKRTVPAGAQATVFLATAVCLAVLLLAAPGTWAQNIGGDPGAWEELVAAYAQLDKLWGFRVRITAPGLVAPITAEVVPPDRLRMRAILKDKGVLVGIFVGKEARFRIEATAEPGHPLIGKWLCLDVAPLPRPELDDLTTAVESVTAVRLDESVIDGERVQGYEFTSTGTYAGLRRTIGGRAYVLVSRQVPRRLEALERGRLINATDYYDYNASFTIDLPRCEMTLPRL